MHGIVNSLFSTAWFRMHILVLLHVWEVYVVGLSQSMTHMDAVDETEELGKGYWVVTERQSRVTRSLNGYDRR